MPEQTIPTVVAESKATFMGIEMRVLQLSDGTRIIPSEDVAKFFELLGNPPTLCDFCGTNPVTLRIGEGDTGVYFCEECRGQAEAVAGKDGHG